MFDWYWHGRGRYTPLERSNEWVVSMIDSWVLKLSHFFFASSLFVAHIVLFFVWLKPKWKWFFYHLVCHNILVNSCAEWTQWASELLLQFRNTKYQQAIRNIAWREQKQNSTIDWMRTACSNILFQCNAYLALRFVHTKARSRTNSEPTRMEASRGAIVVDRPITCSGAFRIVTRTSNENGFAIHFGMQSPNHADERTDAIWAP